ncbi:MAG: HAMP domain-containing protein [Pseudomonadota bacterium]|nr:HAMP domain-containing protein [Pseudomonadota bacterium]
MKIQYKFALIMTSLGLFIVLLLSGGYYIINRGTDIKMQRQTIANISKELAQQINLSLIEKTKIATTLASAPIIKASLRNSNSEFAVLPEPQRSSEIDRLNQQWLKAETLGDPFIQARMLNPLAAYFKLQQKLIPEEYGEIFLTNRYGVMIATTAKLTTLAHAHKYWWLACDHAGQGRIFLDDRGFDCSVQGYVLGFVVPVRDKNEIIGILKCNVNIKRLLTDIVHEFNLRNPNILKIVRSGGLVVSEIGHPPLSTQVSDTLVETLRQKMAGNTTDGNQLVAFAPIPVTMESSKIGFGGKNESIDHILGNQGEGWFAVIFNDKANTIKLAQQTTLIITLVGIVFTILTALLALFLGRWAVRPIVELAATVKTIGAGSLDKMVKVSSNDEIGSLAKSFNQMTKNLKESMTSRDNLMVEVDQRKKAEADKKKIIVELEEALSQVKTLTGIIPICMHCKVIRDEKGAWNQLEKYILEHSDAQFSHGICDKCLKEHYPEYSE